MSMSDVIIQCERCGAELSSMQPAPSSSCSHRIVFRYDYERARLPTIARSMWDYGDLLPLRPLQRAVSLGEGATPLVSARGDWSCQVYWKLESCNPTGSQKDRALSVTISMAAELGAGKVVMASTGSAGLSCAAYCARAGLPCVVLVPRGTPPERLLPMQGLGARIIEIDGTFTDIERLLDEVSREGDWFDATTKRSSNPFHVEGPKTIAYEIVEVLNDVPDWIIVPVGGGATLFGIWRGIQDLLAMRRIERLPRLVAVQPASFNTLQRALQHEARTFADLTALGLDETVETVMRNLKHGVPPDGVDALVALRESGGLTICVTDAEALEWQRRLGADEGILAEPSAAAAAAGIDKLVRDKHIGQSDRVVGIVTGSGLREIASFGTLSVARLAAGASAFDLDQLLKCDGKAFA